jgi:hypothetical protein
MNFTQISLEGLTLRAQKLSVTGAASTKLYRHLTLSTTHFAYYNLTKYFLAYAVVNLIRTEAVGAATLQNIDTILTSGRLQELLNIFGNLAKSLAVDLNAEIVGDEAENFDYKNELKSPTWCKKISARLVAQYSKDVIRKKADPIGVLCADLATGK